MKKSRRATLERRLHHLKENNAIQKKISLLSRTTPNKVPSLRILGASALSRKPFKASNLFISSSGDHHAKLGEYAAQLYKNQSMTDVLIVVQSEEFKSHKAVLACHSPYFKEVLNKPGFNEIHYLQIPSVTAKAFEILLEYMYTGELKVNCQELSEVFRAAKRLGVKGATSKCIELLQVTEEHFENMVYLYVTARKLDLLDASARGFKLMVLNFEKLITTKEFLDLEIDQITELFNSDEIGARSEVIVFMAALKWLDYDFFEREEYVEKIFKCMRFPLMTMEEILACYHPPVLTGLMERPEIRQTLLNATCYITAKYLGQEVIFSELASKPRTFLFGGEPFDLWDVSMFDVDKYEERKKQNAATKIQALFRGYITRKRVDEEIFVANYAATVVQSVFRGYCVRKTVKLTKTAMQRKGRSAKNYLLRMDNRSGLLKAYTKRTFEIFDTDMEPERHIVVYAMGAFDADNDGAPNSLFAFDTLERSWEFLGQCLAPRHDSRMAYLDGYIYIIGGFNPLSRTQIRIMLPLKECHRFHPESKQWREMPEMNEARSSHAVAILNEQILAIGGKNEANKVLSSIEKYDMSVGKWKKFSPSLPEPRMAMGCTIHRGMLWIAGGISHDGKNICMMDSVWCLDHKTCRWTKKLNLPYAVAFPTLISDGEDLFCIGGASRPFSYEREELESTDKIYKFEKGRWVEQFSMPFQGHSLVGCKSGKTLFFLGGFNSYTMSHIQDPVCIDMDENKGEELSKIPSETSRFIIEGTISWK